MMHTQTPSMVPPSVPALTFQVIGTGFGRAATTSRRGALVRLGFGTMSGTSDQKSSPTGRPMLLRFALTMGS
jgi:hypothetical protein